MKIPLDYCTFHNKVLETNWRLFDNTFPKSIFIESHLTGIIQEFVVDLAYVQYTKRNKKKLTFMQYIPLNYLPNVISLIVKK